MLPTTERLARFKKFLPPIVLQASILMTYNIVARLYFNFERSNWVLAAGCAIGILLGLGLNRFRTVSLTAICTTLVISLGGMLQIYSPQWWPYLLVPVIAMVGRRFIRVNGRHIFNPSNFALVCLFELFPGWVINSPQLFSGYAFVSLIFLGLGLINALYSGTWVLSLTWYAGFIATSVVRYNIQNPAFFLAYQALNPLLLLFTFHMINDPQTTPKSWRGQVVFALSVAFVDAILRFNQYAASPYYALALVSAAKPLVESWALSRRSLQ